MLDRDLWELASYVVTVIGLPAAIAIFVWEQRKERANEEDEVYQLLANAYNDFLKVVIDNPDLQLRTKGPARDLTPEQRERMLAIFDMLIALFERAYLTAWSPDMTPAQARRWNSWEDFMREWIRRDDFYFRLPELLKGEDPEFADYLRRLAADERGRPIAAP
jgi:type II secretory pathway pseudopilin PulG